MLVTIRQILKKWQQFVKIQYAAAILKSTLLVEPPSREINSLFVIFYEKCNFYWNILTFKGSLLSGALTIKRFLQEIGHVKMWRLFGPETSSFLNGDVMLAETSIEGYTAYRKDRGSFKEGEGRGTIHKERNGIIRSCGVK